MKMRNPRAGHAPGVTIFPFLALVLAIIAGWPVALPMFFILAYLPLDAGSFLCKSLLNASIVVGAYLHFKIWVYVWTGFKAWWIR
jgi:hypothetical protein